MTRQDRMLRVALCCFVVGIVTELVALYGPETVAAAVLAIVASVGVTFCLAMMADGRAR